MLISFSLVVFVLVPFSAKFISIIVTNVRRVAYWMFRNGNHLLQEIQKRVLYIDLNFSTYVLHDAVENLQYIMIIVTSMTQK